jgi:hypothetical protein
MYSCQLCLLRVVQAAVVDAVFCYVSYMQCECFMCGPLYLNIFSPYILSKFFLLRGQSFVTCLIYFCINPYVFLVFHILS